MTKAKLKTGRITVPGIVILLGVVPILFAFHIDPTAPLDTKTVLTVCLALATAIGYAWRLLDIRGRYFRPGLARVQTNIVHRLLAPFAGDPQITAKAGYSWKGFQKLFYHFVDTDPSLKNKADDVYENGLIWSSLLDLKIGATVYGLVYMIIVTFVLPSPVLFFAIGVSAILIFLSGVCIEMSIQRHIRLGNDQLDHIIFHHRPKLEEMLRALGHD